MSSQESIVTISLLLDLIEIEIDLSTIFNNKKNKNNNKIIIIIIIMDNYIDFVELFVIMDYIMQHFFIIQ